ncbi:MAG: UDP-2,3-diacylglucosamine diphosphatase LpxI [Alphaproteobacteria bacterium]|nr:UDP-2,3-diacylglucosamine diphosphatase LpxI [Alphaproteobacteria bacterium]
MAEKLGIIAGGGTLPKQLIDRCRKEGRPYSLVCLKDFALPETAEGEDCLWCRMGEAGKAIAYFKKNGVRQIVMIGGVRRPSLFQLRLDWWSTKFLIKIGFKAFGDDNLLSAVIKEIEAEGFQFIGIHDVMPDLLADEGVWGKVEPDEQAWNDIRHGIKIALGLGALDVGQSVIVQQGIVLGVEAVEGTDALIGRCKDLKREGVGGVLVKTKKPHQEKRADLPTIGVRTVLNVHDAGLRGIAIQAGNALVADRATVIAKADELGIFIVGVKCDDAG